MRESGEFVLPIGTVTLVLADVQGSTRQWEERPEEMRAALHGVDKVVVATVAARHGVRYLSHPGGSVRSDEVDDACREHGVFLGETGIRLFHH